MSHSEDDDDLLNNAVAGHIASVTEVDDPVSELIVHVLYRAAHARLLLQHPNPKTIDLYRTLCSIKVFRRRKARDTLHIPQSLG